MQKNQKSIDNSKLKESVSVLELEVRQLKEQISLLKDNEKMEKLELNMFIGEWLKDLSQELGHSVTKRKLDQLNLRMGY